MKILHLLYQSDPNVSGSSTRSRQIANSQKKYGMEPVFITSPFQPGYTDLNIELVGDVKVYRTWLRIKSFLVGRNSGFLTKILKILTLPYFTYSVYRVARVENPEVLHSHAMSYCAIAGIIVSRLLSIPHVYEIRSKWEINSHANLPTWLSGLFHIIDGFVVKRINTLVVISEGLKRIYKGKCKNVHLIGNAVPREMIRKKKITWKRGKARLIFGYIGSVIPLEGLNYLVDAISDLNKDGYLADLLIYGDGSYRAHLEAYVKVNQIENISFMGTVAYDQIDTAYENIDVIVNYRVGEPIAHLVTPLKPLEAMAYSVLVVVSDVGGMKELVTDKVTGIVVPSDDLSELICALKNVMDNHDLLSVLSSNAREFLYKSRTWESNAEKYLAIYKKIKNQSL